MAFAEELFELFVEEAASRIASEIAGRSLGPIVSVAKFIYDIGSCSDKGYTTIFRELVPCGEDVQVYLPVGLEMRIGTYADIVLPGMNALSTPAVLVRAGGTQTEQTVTISEGTDEIQIEIPVEIGAAYNEQSYVIDPLDIGIDLFSQFKVESPVTVAVFDSQGRATGVIGNRIVNDIPNSVYDVTNETISIFGDSDAYSYRIYGEDLGTYGARAIWVNGGELEAQFHAVDIPTSPRTVHEYIFDMQVLSQDGSGVTVNVDSEGDGTFEYTITSGALVESFMADIGGAYESEEGASAILDASRSYCFDRVIEMYEWDLDGDGEYDFNSSSPTESFTWNDDYTGTIGLRITDDEGLTSTDETTVTILNVDPSVDAGLDVTINEGGTFTQPGSFTDPGADEWTATVDYGDGSDVQILPLNPDKTFDLSHIYADNGTYEVTVTVEDDDWGSGTDTAMVTVNNVVPTADAGEDKTGDEPSAFAFIGSHTDPGILDNHTYEWDFDYDGVTFDVDAIGNSVSNTWQDDFNGTVALRVTDSDGDSDIDTCAVVVNNLPPEIALMSMPVDPVQVNTEINVSADFTDPGILDTHTAEWDWGDETTSLGTVSFADGTVTGKHTYTETGVYTVTLTVEDDDGGIATSVYRYVVVYDPDGGFVTGGGWIYSEPGCYIPDESLEGKANFGFVSKYKKGQTTPTGNTEFQFKSGDLNFHSDSYDWLVIAGSRAMYKGVGTINGEGNYGFMLSAIDEKLTPSTEVDLFRIKIWDKDDDDDTVVYDNQMSALEDAEPTTIIGGGNIVIHKAK